MQKIILPSLLLLIGLTSFAQKKHKVTLSPSIVDIQDRPFYIKKVVDARPNQETIGFVQKGLGNRRVDAQFSEPLEVHLQKAFDQMVPMQDGQLPVVAKIHNLYISETTTAWKETGIAEVAIEFLSEDLSKSYGFFQATEQKNGADVTKKHDKRIIAAITNCLISLAAKWGTETTPMQELSSIDFTPDRVIQPGIYLTFSDFLLNQPIATTDFTIEEVAKKVTLYKIRDTQTQKKLKDVYGVHDGQDFYLNAAQYSYATHFTKAQFQGRYVYFEDRVSDTGAAIAFGLIGALASTKTIGVILDTKTGLISELTRDFLAIHLKDYPELRKMYNDSDKKLPTKRAIMKKLNEILAEK
ncbi:MAG: hypothetical protein AAGJ18_05635 [Bacteroidota bacterium]